MSVQAAKKNNIYLHAIIVGIFMFLFRFIPAPAPITAYGMQVLGIFIGLLYGWCFAGNLVWPSLLAIAAMALTDYGGGMAVVGSLFSNASVGLIMFGSFMMGPLNESGAGEWLMAKMLSSKLVAGKPWRITAMLVVGLYGLTLIVSNQILVLLLVMTILPGTLQQAGYTPQDKYSNMLMMGIVIGQLMSIMAFPFHGMALMPIGTMYAATGLTMDIGKWMMVVIPYSFIALCGYVLLMKLMRCDASKMMDISTGAMREKAAEKLSSYAKACLIATSMLLIGCIVISLCGSIHVISNFSIYGWLVLLPALMLIIHIEDKPLLTVDMIKQYFPWDLFLCLASAMFVAGQLTAEGTGIGILLGGVLGSFYSAVGEYMFLVICGLLAIILTNFLNNLAIFMTFVSVFCSLYMQGILTDIYTAVITASLFGCLGFYAPSGSVQGAMAHSFEYTSPKTYYLMGIPAIIYICLTYVVLFLPVCMRLF